MATFGRIIEIALGVFFVGSAAAKALDVDAFASSISAYNVIREPGLVRAAAYFTLALETALGACFLARWRLLGISYAAAIAMTVVFTGLIGYAWKFHGLEDCGCFGTMVSMGPAASILKNIVLIGILAGTWLMLRGKPVPEGEDRRIIPRVATAVAGSLFVFGLTAYSSMTAAPEEHVAPVATASKEKPYEKFQFEIDGKTYNLGTGEYLVALLSPTCPHCQDSVQYLNEYLADGDLPELIALMYPTTAEDLEDFRMLTMPLFPTQTIDELVFLQTLTGSHPPELKYTREGQEAASWIWGDDEIPPAPDQLLVDIKAAEAQGL